jgi:hypothetical protein
MVINHKQHTRLHSMRILLQPLPLRNKQPNSILDGFAATLVTHLADYCIKVFQQFRRKSYAHARDFRHTHRKRKECLTPKSFFRENTLCKKKVTQTLTFRQTQSASEGIFAEKEKGNHTEKLSTHEGNKCQKASTS